MIYKKELTWYWWRVNSGCHIGSRTGGYDGRAVRQRTTGVIWVILELTGQWDLVRVGASSNMNETEYHTYIKTANHTQNIHYIAGFISQYPKLGIVMTWLYHSPDHSVSSN